MAAKISIRGGRRGASARGVDIGVYAEIDGRDVLLPVKSLVLKIGARAEHVVATIELDVSAVDVDGVEAFIEDATSTIALLKRGE